ncbi:MAG: zeta toxin family protein [Clostridia bacterium]|nr:zeta toxin family protein [Clostridia bacterium]
MKNEILDTKKIQELYALSEKQVQDITNNIISVMAEDLLPSEQPLVVVVGGQSGSGKTSLIHYTERLSSDREFIEIDNDYFRSFHPRIEEIRNNHPDYYVTATDQLGLGITSKIIDYFRDHKYNIILHQTLKNNRVVDDAITKFINAGYVVGVRAFAVPYLESKMSQIERCEGQLEKIHFCRHVNKVDHDAAIEGLPKTVEYIEQSGKYDFLEIYRRTEDANHPGLVYSKLNPNTETKTLQVLDGCTYVSKETLTFGFNSARDAVEKTRASEAIKCAKTLDKRIQVAEQSKYNNEVMQMHIDELKEQFELFKKKQKKHKLTIQSSLSAVKNSKMVNKNDDAHELI